MLRAGRVEQELTPEAILNRWPSLSAEWNETQADTPPTHCLHELFEEQVKRSPDAVAVAFAGRQLTYTELNARANRLAHRLQAEGVVLETRVALCTERSLEMMVGLLGILKAGAAYVPLDPKYPPQRLALICQDADVALVLTDGDTRNALTEASVRCLSLEDDATLPSENLPTTLAPSGAAYVIYTSGSTGRPKGVVMSHSALVNLFCWQGRVLPHPYRTLQFTSIGFDVSCQEIFSTWFAGGTLVLINEEDRRDPIGLLRVIAEQKIERLFVPFAVLQLLAVAREEGATLPDSLREVITAGEQLHITEAMRGLFRSGSRPALYNHYGPTETHVVTAFKLEGPVEDWPALPPIGRPIANTTLHLLDENRQQVPVGIAAELYIGGAGLAREYLGQPELTAERFVPDPFRSQPGARLYRTGDLARYLPNGNIEFLGRIDHQVKIRGFRVELGEIENVLLQHPQVREAVVLAREETPGDKRLVAYVVGGEAVPPRKALREFLGEKLPSYMVPSAFVFLEALPLSANGKVERNALPAPDESHEEEVGGAFLAPRSPLEARLVEIWQEALGIRSIGVDANFFDLGGHSLLAIRLLSEIRREFGDSLSLAEMFKAPTVGQMALLLQRKQSGEDIWSPLVPLQPQGENPPLFCTPAGGGSAFYYRKLAEHIGSDQPLYVFEPLGMNGVDAPHTTVEEMAAYYIQHMRTIQPHGPYRLCGLSFGGVVAFVMAQQFMAAGEQISCLILFDSYAPEYVPMAMVTNPWLALQYSIFKMRSYAENMVVGIHLGGQKGYLHSRVKRIKTKFREWIQGTPWKSPAVNPVYMELPEVFQKVDHAEEQARRAYQPQSYNGPMLLLRARLQRPGDQGDLMLGWSRWAPKVEAITTPGTHFSLLEEPCVHVTVKHVMQALDDAKNRPAGS